MNYLSLMDSENEEGAAALRQLLGLYANLAETPVARQVDGVRHCVLEPVHRRVPEPGPVVFARGIGITLTVDERAFSGASPWLSAACWNAFCPPGLHQQLYGVHAQEPAARRNRLLGAAYG